MGGELRVAGCSCTCPVAEGTAGGGVCRGVEGEGGLRGSWELPSARWWRVWGRRTGSGAELASSLGTTFLRLDGRALQASSLAERDKIQPRTRGGGQSPELMSPSKAVAGPARVGEAVPGHRRRPHACRPGRNYTVANVEKGLLEVQRMSCAGMKLSCQLKIHSCLWTATEVSAQRAGQSPRRAAPSDSPWGPGSAPRNAGNLETSGFPVTPARTRAAPEQCQQPATLQQCLPMGSSTHLSLAGDWGSGTECQVQGPSRGDPQ